jgi:hypothetical protein
MSQACSVHKIVRCRECYPSEHHKKPATPSLPGLTQEEQQHLMQIAQRCRYKPMVDGIVILADVDAEFLESLLTRLSQQGERDGEMRYKGALIVVLKTNQFPYFAFRFYPNP